MSLMGVDIGTSEVLDSPFARASLELWKDTIGARASGGRICSLIHLLFSWGLRWGSELSLPLSASTCCSPLYIRAAFSKFLTLDSLSLFWYIFACHLQCYIWLKEKKMGLTVIWPGKDYLIWYFFKLFITSFVDYLWEWKHLRFLASSHASG